MAVNLGTAYIQIQPSTKGLIPALKKELSGFDGVSKQAGESAGTNLSDGMGSGIKDGMPGLSKFMLGAFVGLGAAIGAGMGKALMASIMDAADVEQSRGGLEAILGKGSKSAAMAKDADMKYGLSEDEFNRVMTSSAGSYKGRGIKDYENAALEDIERASDMAAMYGGTTEEALDAILSAQRGQFDPIERYNVNMSAKIVNDELAARGQDKLTGSAYDAAKAQVVQDIIMKQTTDTMGTFSAEADTMSGQQQRLAAQWANLKVSIGEVFLPVITTVLRFINDHVIPGLEKFVDSIAAVKEYISANRDWAMPLIVGLTAFTSALTAYFAVIAAGAGLKMLGPLLGGMAKGLLAGGPIGLIIAAVAAVGAALYWFFTQTEVGKEIWDKVWTKIKEVAQGVADWFMGTVVPLLAQAWEKIQEVAKVVADWFMGTLVPILSSAWDTIKDTAKSVADWFMGTLLPILTSVWDQVSAVAMKAADWFMTHVAPVFQAFGNLVMAIVEEWIIPGFQKLGDFVGWVVNTLILPAVGFLKRGFELLGAAWGWLWGHIQAVWAVVGPPLIELIKGLFRGLGIALKVIWDAIVIVVETVLGVIKGVFNTAAAAIRGDWGAAWEAFKGIFSTVWDGIKRGITNSIDGLKAMLSNAWETIKNVAEAAWGGVRDTVMGVVDPFLDALKSGIQNFGDTWAAIWDGLKKAAAAPINFIIGTVWNDGLRKVLNWVFGVFGGTPLPPAALIGETRSTSSKAISAYARGGILPGWSRASHGDDQLIMARRGEGITVSEAMDPYEKQRLLALNQAALKGIPAKSFREQFEGHATGGIVGFRGHKFTDTFRDTLLAAESLAKTTFRISQGGFRPRTSYSGTSHQGDAVDLTPVTGTIVRALRQAGVAAWDRTGKGNWNPHIHGVPLPGYGRGAGSAVWQAQEYLKGRDGLGGRDNGPKVGVNRAATSLGDYTDDGGNLLEIIPKAWKSAADGLKELTGPWGDVLKSAMTDVLSKAFDWTVEKVPGLKQIMDLFGNRVGKITTDENRVGPPNMRGYATGTSSALRGPAWVGENGPEIVNFRGGEQVYTAAESAAMTSPVHIENVNLPGVKTFNDLIEFAESLSSARRHGHMTGAVYG